MNQETEPQRNSLFSKRLAIGLARRILRLVVFGLLLTWFYAWDMPRLLPRTGVTGLGCVMLHALTPMVLPALVAGQDITLYAEKNSGRTYRLGYTIGISICGLIVFGTTFWSPGTRPAVSALPVPAVAGFLFLRHRSCDSKR